MNLELREISQTRRLKTHDSTPVRNLKQSDPETESSVGCPAGGGRGVAARRAWALYQP